VFLGCSDVDFHIPAVRVSETAAVLRRMGANVTMKLYPGMGHLVNEDEIAHVNAMIQEVAGSTA
jgi:predicted esterase